MLLTCREAPEQREDLGVAETEVRQGLDGVAYLALAGAEHQDVPGALGGQLGDCIADGGRLVPRIVAVVVQRAVADVDRVRAAGDLDHRCVGEVVGESLRVDGRRGDDHLEVGSTLDQAT